MPLVVLPDTVIVLPVNNVVLTESMLTVVLLVVLPTMMVSLVILVLLVGAETTTTFLSKTVYTNTMTLNSDLQLMIMELIIYIIVQFIAHLH